MSHPDESRRIIEAVAHQLGGGGVQHTSMGEWEWRGVLSGERTRARCQRTSCEIHVDAPCPFGAFQLQWGPELVPDPSAADVAFDVTDEVRVWVGRCVVIQCFGLELEQQLAAFRAFPPQGAHYLIEGMQRDQVRVLGIERDQLLAFVALDQPDAAAATVRFANLLAWTGAQLRQLAPSAGPAATGGRVGGASPLRCTYCKALFLLTASSQCPQCGAPART